MVNARASSEATEPRVDEELAPEPAPEPDRRQRRRRLLVALALAAVVLAMLLVRALAPPVVRVVTVTRGVAVDAIYASGTVEAINRVEIRARIAGAVDAIAVKEGERVPRGALLAHLDVPTLAIDVDRGRAEAQAARMRSTPSVAALRAQEHMIDAQLSDARVELGRFERLSRVDGTPATELARAQLHVATLEQQLEMVRAQQRETEVMRQADVVRSSSDFAGAQARSRDAEVRAPIDGDVLRVIVDLGRVVQPNEPLLRIGDARHLQLEAVVDEEDLGRVRLGAECAVRIAAFGDRVLRGRVTHIAPEADREHHSFRIFVALDQPPADLRPGMSTEIDVIAARHPGAILVPREAVRDGRVWRLEDGHLRHRAVDVGVGDLDHVEVLGGLGAGDRVVLLPDPELVDGMRARGLVVPDVPAHVPNK